jgi:hypothetical protein
VGIFLIWTLLKKIAYSLLPRRLIHEKEQVLPHVDLSENKKKETGHGQNILERSHAVERRQLRF